MDNLTPLTFSSVSYLPVVQPVQFSSSRILRPDFMARDTVHFSGGKKKERFNADNQALEKKLLDAGVTKETMKSQWGITMWSLRQNGNTVRVKLETTGKKFDPKAFSSWLLDLVADKGNGIKEVRLYEKPVSKCCKKPCEGCLMGNKSKRKTWIG